MSVSSNSLVHFTKKFDTIVAILESQGFWPKYCVEFGWKDKRSKDLIEFAVPQSCFCDIPFSNIKEHMGFYGPYGIVMTKEWGVKNGLSPVLYIVKKSHLTQIIKDFRKIAKGQDIHRKILAFVKLFEGVYYRYDEDIKEWIKVKNNYLYYNEREWRFVPKELDKNKMVIKVDNLYEFDKESLSEITKNYMLKFQANDVKYIIVKNDENRFSLIKKIQSMTHLNQNEQIKLCSCIITKDFIDNDI